MAVVNKWDNVCRLCSEEKNEMLSIFGDEGLQRKVAQKLRACLPVLVYKTDPLPKQICQFCAARLDDAYEFREYCLNVYKNMYAELLTFKDSESAKIFLNAMRNSLDPCQAKLCKEKPRGPPPLLPLTVSLPFDTPPVVIEDNEYNSNIGIETLSEIPCEVEINELNTTTLNEVDVVVYNGSRDNIEFNNELNTNKFWINTDERQTSILEQALTGNLSISEKKELKTREILSSKYWCAPCNIYFKTEDSLSKHLQLSCPRKYACKKCPEIFDSVKDLAKHEAFLHLKVLVDLDELDHECHECGRQFISEKMLKQHRLRDHLGSDIDIGTNTWCSLCNRFFVSIENYENHMQLHQPSAYSLTPLVAMKNESEITMTRINEKLNDFRKEHIQDNPKSLICPTCGKVCTQQSALSNHMRTHEPKKYKCEICGRSFGLFIRLAAHRLSEHNQQPVMSPVMASVEQEEALNAEREAREAREARSRGKSRIHLEKMEIVGESFDEHSIMGNTLSNPNVKKNVARCGICSQWFNDHTTMLLHLETHSDNFTCKMYSCHVCNKTFKEDWQLYRHEVTHKRAKSINLHTCNVCNKSFAEKSILKAHQKTHVVTRTYHCSKCNKLFFKEVSLLTHQCKENTFIDETSSPKSVTKIQSSISKKYICSLCNATFSSSQSKNLHMRTHAIPQMSRKQSSDKYKENESMPTLNPEAEFAEITVPLIEAKVEIREENPPPPMKRTLIRTSGGFRCGVCQSPFVLREIAIAHLRSAHPTIPFQCPYCKKRFTTQYSFTHHIKTEHPEEPEN